MDSLVGRNDGGGCGGSGRRRRQRSGERGRDPGKGARARESEGERQGGEWCHLDASGRLGGKQEVARAASAPATELLRCEGRKTTGGVAVVGWAVLLGQVGYQVSAR